MSRKALPCKACVERSDYFRAARRHKNNDIISGCRKAGGFFDSLRNGAAFAAPFRVLLPRRALRLEMIVRVLKNSGAGLQKCRIYLQKLHF